MTPLGPVLAVAAAYIAAFAGRTDVYGIYTPDGWRPRRSPLTPSVVLDAFANGSPITFYFLAPDEMTHVAAIDFDTGNGFEQAVLMGCVMWDDGVPAYIETSRRGAHLWSVLDGQLHALALRSAHRTYLQAAGLPANDQKIELRPGERVGTHGIGLALRAPMMPHPVTGVAGTLLDPRTQQPLGGSLAEVMQTVQRAPAATMAAAAERYRPPAPPPVPRYPQSSPRYPAPTPRYPGQRGRGRIERFNAENIVSEMLSREFRLITAAPGRSVRCPGPTHRNGDRSPSLSILPDDRRAYCHVPGCAFNGSGHGVDAFDLDRIAKDDPR